VAAGFLLALAFAPGLACPDARIAGTAASSRHPAPSAHGRAGRDPVDDADLRRGIE